MISELRAQYEELVAQQDVIEEEARAQGIDPYRLRDINGNYILAPILVAKANVLSVMATRTPDTYSDPAFDQQGWKPYD